MPLSAHSGSEHGAGGQGDSGMERGEDIITMTMPTAPPLIEHYSLFPSSAWVLVAPLGDRQDKNHLKDGGEREVKRHVQGQWDCGI